MLKKIHLTSVLAALILFLFPWVDIRCSDRSFATQTGIQIVYGGGSFADEAEKGRQGTMDDPLGISPLSGLALLLIVLSAGLSILTIKRKDVSVDRLALFPLIALALLLLQLAVGFPAKDEVHKILAEERAQYDVIKKDKFEEMLINGVHLRMKPAFFLELLALGIPVLILLNGWIDKCRKTEV